MSIHNVVKIFAAFVQSFLAFSADSLVVPRKGTKRKKIVWKNYRRIYNIIYIQISQIYYLLEKKNVLRFRKRTMSSVMNWIKCVFSSANLKNDDGWRVVIGEWEEKFTWTQTKMHYFSVVRCVWRWKLRKKIILKINISKIHSIKIHSLSQRMNGIIVKPCFFPSNQLALSLFLALLVSFHAHKNINCLCSLQQHSCVVYELTRILWIFVSCISSFFFLQLHVSATIL